MNNNLTYCEVLKRASQTIQNTADQNDRERRIFYSLINTILEAYQHTPTRNRTELNVIMRATQTTPRHTNEETKQENLFLNMGRVKNFIMKENASNQSLRNIILKLKNKNGKKKYTPPKINKPYTLKYFLFFFLTESDKLEAVNWTAEQERRELLKKLKLQFSEILQMVYSLDIMEWQAYELVELFEEIELIYYNFKE